MTEKEQISFIKFLIEDGVDLNYGKLSICDLRNYINYIVKRNKKYQVHCEDAKMLYSSIYYDLEQAINKFMELKTKVRRKH